MMDFNDILIHLLNGKKAARKEWRDMYIRMYHACYFHFGPNPGDLSYDRPEIMMTNLNTKQFENWPMHSADISANDWYIID